MTLATAIAGSALARRSCYPLDLLSYETITAASLAAKPEHHGVPNHVSAALGPSFDPMERLSALLDSRTNSDGNWGGQQGSGQVPMLAWNVEGASPQVLATTGGALLESTQVGIAASGRIRLVDANRTLLAPAVLWSLQSLACASPRSDDECTSSVSIPDEEWYRPLLAEDTLAEHVAGTQVDHAESAALSSRPFPWTFFSA